MIATQCQSDTYYDSATNKGYQLGERGTKIDHLLFKNYLKLYGKTIKNWYNGAMVHTVRVVSGGIGMQFGIDKYTVLCRKKSNGIALIGDFRREA